MRLNDDGKTVRAMDTLAPRIGEIIGGSQREERWDVLRQRMQKAGIDEDSYWWYLGPSPLWHCAPRWVRPGIRTHGAICHRRAEYPRRHSLSQDSQKRRVLAWFMPVWDYVNLTHQQPAEYNVTA